MKHYLQFYSNWMIMLCHRPNFGCKSMIFYFDRWLKNYRGIGNSIWSLYCTLKFQDLVELHESSFYCSQSVKKFGAKQLTQLRMGRDLSEFLWRTLSRFKTGWRETNISAPRSMFPSHFVRAYMKIFDEACLFALTASIIDNYRTKKMGE